mmetsp:Transcript_41358/g.114963  ORF Transcript_41358/g.114963 Transcript_41358/m.114963 type:complete len:404 (+) Transcript_41358:496-1707(+)
MYSKAPESIPFLIAPLHADGTERMPPGRINATGNRTAVATAVSTASWLVLRVVVSEPISPTLPNFVARTLRVTKAKFEAMAVRKPNMVKESSEEEARATPRKTGAREAYTMGWKTCPRINAEAMAFTAGSSAFTTCVKDTATAPSDATVATCPAEKAAPTGANLRRSLLVTLGTWTRPVAHMSMAMGIPAANWIHETAHVASKQLNSFLFWMLYCTLKKYHSPTKIGSFTLLKSFNGPEGSDSFSGSAASSPSFSGSAAEAAAALAAAKAVAAKTRDTGASAGAPRALGAAAAALSAKPARGRGSASACCGSWRRCCCRAPRCPAGGTWNARPELRLSTATEASATSTNSPAGSSSGRARGADRRAMPPLSTRGEPHRQQKATRRQRSATRGTGARRLGPAGA